MEDVLKKLLDNVEIALPENGLAEKLKVAKAENRPLVIKLGLDPTRPDIHLGHTVVLKKLRQFQDLGHQVVLIVGDFTALIGDPTGRSKTRPKLSEEEIKENAKTYFEQVKKILDPRKTKAVFNSSWLSKLSLRELISIMAKFNLSQILSRDDFKNRLNASVPISLHELLYPLMQGYDSVEKKADIEIGGTDQLFNMQIAREVQAALKQAPQAILCLPILRGLDGKEKMSKSLNNYIGITETPNDIFGKIMAMPDELIPEYLDLVCDFSPEEQWQFLSELKQGRNPLEIKKEIAKNIISQYHSKEAGERAAEFFYRQFQSKNLSQIEYTEVSLNSLGLDARRTTLAEVLVVLRVKGSKSEARRLIAQGAVTIDGKKITDIQALLKDLPLPINLRAGQRGFYKLVE